MNRLLTISALLFALHYICALPTERNDTQVAPAQNEALPISVSQVKPKQQEKLDPQGQQEEETVEEESKEDKPEEETDSLENDDKDEDEEAKEPEIEDEAREEEEEEEEEAELNPYLFEGDLKLSKLELDNLKENTISKRDAVAAKARRWPDARVPFVLSKKFAKDKGRMAVLRAAIRKFRRFTCVRFVPKKATDTNYIKFIIGRGCYSTSVGKKRWRREQKVSIGNGCTRIGTVIHEMMHAIGFFHEHTRLDRDQFIRIIWNNIQRKKESQFMKYAHGEADYLNEPYDYDSVMHYSRNGFGIKVNGKKLPTIIPKNKPWREIGQRRGFSRIDLRQINKLYRCKSFTSKY